MPTTTTPATDAAQIREFIDASAQALRAKDINALMAHYAPDVVVFDLMPLQTQGADAYRKNFEAWFASVQGPIDYQISDLGITRSDDVASCHYVGHVRSYQDDRREGRVPGTGDRGLPEAERPVDDHPRACVGPVQQ